MAKKQQGTVVTPRDIAKALDGITAWIRGVRSTVLKMDKKTRVKLPKKSKGMAAAPSVPMLDGCPPPPPPRPKKKSR